MNNCPRVVRLSNEAFAGTSRPMPKKKTYPLKLTGHINWAPVSVDDTIGVVVKRALIRSKDEIVLSCECDGYQYNVSLRRTTDSSFEGHFVGSSGQKSYQVSASCTLYSSDDAYFLFGKWVEAGDDFRWWSELTRVERFADEK